MKPLLDNAWSRCSSIWIRPALLGHRVAPEGENSIAANPEIVGTAAAPDAAERLHGGGDVVIEPGRQVVSPGGRPDRRKDRAADPERHGCDLPPLRLDCGSRAREDAVHDPH